MPHFRFRAGTSTRRRLLAVVFATALGSLLGLGTGGVSAQVMTVPDTDDIPPPRSSASKPHRDCPRGQICTVCLAGCTPEREGVIHARPRVPAASKDTEEARLAGQNRHPASIIVCGPEGTCRGLGYVRHGGYQWDDLPRRRYRRTSYYH